jgi:hypothetical protein
VEVTQEFPAETPAETSVIELAVGSNTIYVRGHVETLDVLEGRR